MMRFFTILALTMAMSAFTEESTAERYGEMKVNGKVIRSGPSSGGNSYWKEPEKKVKGKIYDVKQAEYYDFGKGATVTFLLKKADGKVDLRVKNPATGEVTPNTFQKRVLWITKAVRKSVPIDAGGDGVEEEVYIYQFEDGAVWHTVAAKWKDPIVVVPVEANPLAVVDSNGNVLTKLIKDSRCGDIVAIDGEELPAPPKMRVEVFCRCNGEIKSRKWVQVMMDGKEHYWPDDK